MFTVPALLRHTFRNLPSRTFTLLHHATPTSIPKPRLYHSPAQPNSPPFPPAESAILSAALSHVPSCGFSSIALSKGALDAGYLDVSTNLFPRGAFEIVNYHLVTQRLGLKEGVQFPKGDKTGVDDRVRALVMARLRGNEMVIHRWQEALALMATPSAAPASLAELARLSDEIWYLSGDNSVDSFWYTKRASLSALYSATEVYMTTDKSPNFTETEDFLDRRLEDLRNIGGTLGVVGEWMGYTAQSVVNVARSKGVNI